MNLQAYADHRKAHGLRGTSHVAVLKAIESGRLTEPAVRKDGKHWRIDATLADAQWAGNTDTSTAGSAAPQITGDLPLPPNSRQPHPAGGGPSLAEAKRARAVYQAELTRLEMMRAKGELVLASEVRNRWYENGRTIRDNLISITARIASQLAASSDTREVSRLLGQEINRVLEVLSDG
jgi:hypothetical protein